MNMPWKVGGNFEAALITCETNWKECTIAIVNYLWCELVSDVVDYLTTQGILWVLTIIIISVILFHIKNRKKMRGKSIIVSKHILNRVGYKIHDLELKVNVLTYKIQYGTWPSPYQIYSLNPKKLQKIRMTVSDPGNRRNWLKQLPLSICSRQSEMYMPNMSRNKSDQSNDKNFVLQYRDIPFLPLNMDKINRQTWRSLSMQDGKDINCSTNPKYNPCQKFANTVHECKSFLKKLECNDKHSRLLSYSSEKSEVSSLNDIHVTRQQSLPKKRNISRNICERIKENDVNEMKYMNATKKYRTEDIYEVYRRNNVNGTSADAIIATNNKDVFPKQLTPTLPIFKSAHNILSSQETLYEVRKRLQSLHNVLRTYEDMNRYSEGQESLNSIGEVVESFVSAEPRIEEIDEKKADSNDDADQKNLQQIQCSIVDSCECFQRDQSEQSSSSLVECSSNISNKTYRFSSNVMLQNTRSKNQHSIIQKTAWMDDFPALITIQSEDSSSFHNAMSYAPEYYENRCERNTCNTSDRERSYGLKSNSNEDVAEMNASFNLAEKKSEALSEKIHYILSPESIENVQFENQTFLATKKIASGNGKNIFDKEEYEGNIISQSSSRNKISKNNDKEERSTAMLLREALRFKKALLTQVMSEKENLYITKGSDSDGSPSEHEMQNKNNNNLSPIVLDIKTEESDTDASHEKINQRYVYLEMKQQRDLFPQFVQDANAFTYCESEGSIENKSFIPETPSEYFSISDLAIHDEIENNIPLSLEPIYEKVISITMPTNVDDENIIDTNEKSIQTKTIDTRTNSHQSLSKNADDISSNAANSLTTLKLEDLIVERIKNIRDYMDTFLRSQNKEISKACRALRSGNDIFQRSNEMSHILHNQLTTLSSCENNNLDAKFSEDSQQPNILINALSPNYQIFIENDILKCCSDLSLKRSPEIFTVIAPIKNAFFNENNMQQSKVVTESKKRETDLSSLVTSRNSCENVPYSTKYDTSLDKSNCKEYVILNTEDSEIDEQMANINADFQKLGKQTQPHTESKFLEIHPQFDSPRNNITIQMTAAEHEHATSHYNSIISKSNSFFTDKAVNAAKIGKESSESTFNAMHSNIKLHERAEIKANAVKRQIPVYKGLNTNIVTSNKLPLNTKYSNLDAFIGSSLIPNKLGCDYMTDVKTKLKENSISYNPDILPSSSSNMKQKILKTDNNSLNDIKQNKSDETLAHIARLSPLVKDPIKQLGRTYSRIKAKSDMFLTNYATKNLKINYCPKRSHSFIRHDSSENMCKMLRQSNTKLHNNKNIHAQSENESRSTTQLKSTISSQKISTKFCIPILKDRIEAARRIKRQTYTRSPTRGPLTMLRREKAGTKSRTANEEIMQRNNIPINRMNLRIEETALDLAKLNTVDKIFTKELAEAHTTCRKSNITPKNNSLSSEQSMESLEINKEYSDKRFLRSSRADTRVVKNTENTIPKTVAIISIMTDDNLSRNCMTDSFIIKTEKEVTAKPSTTDTCTSISDLHSIN